MNAASNEPTPPATPEPEIERQQLNKDEEALRQGELRFRALVEKSSDGIALADANGTILYASPGAARMVGIAPEEMVGRNTFDSVHPEDVQRARETFARLLQMPGASLLGQFRLRHKDGSWLWVEGIGTNLLDDPNVGAMLANYRDITDRKRGEEALQYQATLVEHVSDAIIATDREFKITLWNRAAETIYGWQSEQVLGHTVAEILETEFSNTTREISAAQLLEQGFWQGEIVHKRKDGRRISMLASTSLIRDASGHVIGAVTVNRDITERKRTEEALRRLAAVVESANDAIVGLNLDATIVSWNPAAERLYGYSELEVLGKSVTFLLPPDRPSEIPEYLERVKRGEWLKEYETVRMARDCRLINISLTVSPIRDEDGRVVGASTIARDITERKRAEEELRKTTERLQALSNRLVETQEIERRQIARELHDQVGQNLTALNIDLEAIHSQLPPESSEKVGSFLKESIQLVEDTVTRIRDIMAELRPSALDDYGLTAAIEWYARQFIRRTGIEVIVDAAGLAERMPLATETALFRICQEALTNIAKHAEAKHVRITLESCQAAVKMIIVDDGIGFSFDQARDPSERAGLGLVGMRERAEAVGGRIRIDAAPGEGTRVTVQVPRKEDGNHGRAG